MNSQPTHSRYSASQGSVRTPKNYIQQNIAKAKEYGKKHQATPMPQSSKDRTSSQPAPKLGRVLEVGEGKQGLGTVREETSQSGEKLSGQKFAAVVFGEEVPSTGTSYSELIQKKAVFEEDQRRLSTPKSPAVGQKATSSLAATPMLVNKSASKPTTPQPPASPF